MPDIWMDVDTALSEVPVNLMPLIDDADFKTIEDAVAYNASGMDLRWNFVTTGGSFTSTPVTPTTSGTYDWTHQGDGIYTIEIPASGGASINNDTEGFGWFSGKATGVYPWRGPVIGFRAAAVNDALIDGGDTLDVNVTQWKGSTAPDMTGDAYARIGANGAGLSAVPWNAAWDAEVQSECADALAAYDTPTKAEMDARTLAAADYATSTNLATAQADLDILTGTDGVILATTQANYAPAKAGDEMDLVDAPNATAVTAIQSGLSTHSAADVWSVGTRVLTAGTNIVLAKGTGITGFNDIAATAIVSGGAITTSGGAVSTVTTVATTTNLTNLPTIPNNWITAAGIAADAVTEIQSGLATASALATVDSNVDTILVTTDKLDDTLELDSTVYRFTVNALEQAPSGGGGGGDATEANQLTIIGLLGTPAVDIAADIAAVKAETASIVADTNELQGDWANGGRLDLILDARASQTSVDTIDSNVDAILEDTGTTLPGTLNLLGGYIDTEVAAIKVVTDALSPRLPVSGTLSTLDSAAVNAACDSALADYDAPTKAELDALQSHGDSNWATASGFSTHSAADVAALVLATPANKLATDANGRIEVSGTITTLDALDTAQDAQHATTQAKTNNLPASPAATGDIPTVSDIWTTALTEAYRATGATGTAAQLLYEIIAHLGNAANAGTTRTLKKLDGSTTAKTYTYDDADNPTSIEEAT